MTPVATTGVRMALEPGHGPTAVPVRSAVFGAVFGPAASAAVPNLVSSEDLAAANVLAAATWGTMLAVGAAIGGLVVVAFGRGAGYIGDLTNGVFGSNYQDVFAFIVLITVLVFRPSGIMGERVADRA